MILSRLAIPLALLVLAGCGGGDNEGPDDDGSAGPTGGAQIAASLGCEGWVDDSEELYVDEGGSCTTAEGTSLGVLWFASTDDKASWLDAASSFGPVKIADEGDRWLAYAP